MSAPNTSDDPKVVIRCGHIIPQIRLTPPDSRPDYSLDLPEQDLGPNMLYVPLRTEEVGWEEGGLIWAPKRFCYPTVNLYGGADDHVIGQYRGGPKGYRYIKITDSNFALAEGEQEDEEQAKETAKPSSSSSKKDKSKSSLPRGPVTTKATPSTATDSLSPSPALSMDDEEVSMSDAASVSSSSASSSRQSSFSTNDSDSICSGVDTGATTPTMAESPASDGKELMASKLNEALEAAALSQSQSPSASSPPTRQMARRTGAGAISSEPVDASRLDGPLKAKLYSNPLGHDRSMPLSQPAAPLQPFGSQPRGRSRSKMALMDYVTPCDGREGADEYDAGWAYEQNTRVEYSNQLQSEAAATIQDAHQSQASR